MRHWQINELDVEQSNPVVIDSEAEGRAIVLQLSAGEKLNEHQVHERAWVLVVAGEIEISETGDGPVSGGPGLLAEFDPNERREISAKTDARLLILLSPWPGEGHPRQRGA